jgi:hypothetical protein
MAKKIHFYRAKQFVQKYLIHSVREVILCLAEIFTATFKSSTLTFLRTKIILPQLCHQRRSHILPHLYHKGRLLYTTTLITSMTALIYCHTYVIKDEPHLLPHLSHQGRLSYTATII